MKFFLAILLFVYTFIKLTVCCILQVPCTLKQHIIVWPLQFFCFWMRPGTLLVEGTAGLKAIDCANRVFQW